MQRADEGLDRFASYYVVRRIALGLNVDLIETQRILINNAVYTAVTGTADTTGASFRSAVAHCYQDFQDRLFQELRVLFAQPGEQLTGHVRVQTIDAAFNLLHRIED